ncbi:sodium- and chloride-dependent neutral and basic amino acid transporter B(0+)-like [Stomoxys calcitrans]|uniref:sodium- and chloride-dependent neutral and basic amino acid transporter B(0+)-like n=1 Tax=Stomoxys calcitrans TaxID=35570 RepID=UPI0027E31DA2|nr:sodium- and chloride-dependent neutral and basic amino acid transporter B(0+)-like [Stomoxys calcitrans]
MVYVSSYESGRAPYAPDKNRGSWLHPDDFIYACISLVFQIDVISRSWLSSIESGVLIFILVYLLSTVIFIVPLMVVKSYLGQFSSSGFISALRISPIFKGMGYVSLIMNICILACNSLFATVPLLYMFASMNPTLPWSCEGFTWTRNLTEDEDTNLCNNESYATKIVSYVDGDNIAHNFTEYKMHNIPSVLYLKYMFHDAKLFYYGKFEFSMAWQLIICTLLVWAIISTMVLKEIQTQTIGTLIRYSMCIVIGLMTSFIIAFSFLPGASKVYENIFDTTHHGFMNTVAYIPICGLAAFGPGWGMVITLSSFNKFNTNVIKSSCLIALGQFGVMLGLEFLIRLSEAFLFANANDNYYRDVEVFWTIYLSSGNVLAHLPWANLWSILFYFMLFLSNLTLTFLQLLSILTSIFDEFVFLRETRVYVITGLLFFLTALSIFFTSNFSGAGFWLSANGPLSDRQYGFRRNRSTGAISMESLYSPVCLFSFAVFLFVPIYLLSAIIYIVPLLVIKSYLGQFSSSGFISAFRLSPLFKGIGFVSLMTNICILAYHSIYAMVPLFYMFASMNPTLPWSCEGFKTWTRNLTDHEEVNLCNIQYNASETLKYVDEDSNVTYNYHSIIYHNIPSVVYFQYLFHDAKLFSTGDNIFSMSWQLIICNLLVWTSLAVVVVKFFRTQTIGTIIRYSFWIVLGLMVFFLIAFSLLPGASNVFSKIFDTPSHLYMGILAAAPIFGLAALGPGWGIVISLSSFNKFNTNIIKSGCLIALGQFGVVLGLDFLAKFSEAFFLVNFLEKTAGNYISKVNSFWRLYLSSGSVMAHLPWPNLWSILFFFMLFLSSFMLMLLQLHSILTSIFDEFVHLREKRVDITMGLLFVLTTISIFFSSNDGLNHSYVLAADALITTTALNLLLILVVLWIYGRERYQRDVEFMTNHRFATWSINILRFVAPLGLILAMNVGFYFSRDGHRFSTLFVDLLTIIFIVIPWVSIPGFAIYQMSRSTGTIKARFMKCCHPTDWYPLEANDRVKYDAAIGSAQITQAISEMT